MLIRLHKCVFYIHTESDMEWNFWHWKLDSFRVPENQAIPDVSIELTHESNPGEQSSLIVLPVIYSYRNGFYSYTIFRSQDGKLIWCMDRPAKRQRVLSFSISDEWNMIKLIEDNSCTGEQLPFELLIHILPGILLKRSIIQLHGVVLEDCGHGILICADSGVGKTTHARLWRDSRKSFIINGDRASCVRDANGWTAFGIPWCGTSGEYMNRDVIISAVVVLERGDVNEANRLSGVDSFFSLLPHLQYPVWDSLLRDKAMDLLQDLTDSVPVIRLRCRPDTGAVDVLEKAISNL